MTTAKGKIQTHKKDIYYTPSFPVELIIKHIPDNVKTILECACGKGHISKILEEHGYKVISTDITTGTDFLKDTINEPYDMIITNPPFSLKSKFLSRCYELKKPFLLLVPITIIESKKRFKLFKEHSVNFLMLPARVDFISSYVSDKVSKAPYFSMWVGILPQYPQNSIIYL